MDDDLMVRAAWLYYMAGRRQDDVAQSLGLSRFKVNRLLAQARDQGIVRIAIDHETTATVALGIDVANRYHLRECLVCPSLDDGADDDAYRRSVGAIAATFLSRRLEHDKTRTIGLGWGRTLSAMADALSPRQRSDVRYVALLGSLNRNSAVHPFDVVQRFAQRTGGEAFLLPAPFVADSKDDAQVFLSQRGVQHSLGIARTADLFVISVGECTDQALLCQSGLLSLTEMATVRQSGAVADTTGLFLDAEGALVETDLTHRIPSVGFDALMQRQTVLLAAGSSKAGPCRAVLNSGLVDILITDQHIAECLLADHQGKSGDYPKS